MFRVMRLSSSRPVAFVCLLAAFAFFLSSEKGLRADGPICDPPLYGPPPNYHAVVINETQDCSGQWAQGACNSACNACFTYCESTTVESCSSFEDPGLGSYAVCGCHGVLD
jgi:hypothetical protein